MPSRNGMSYLAHFLILFFSSTPPQCVVKSWDILPFLKPQHPPPQTPPPIDPRFASPSTPISGSALPPGIPPSTSTATASMPTISCIKTWFQSILHSILSNPQVKGMFNLIRLIIVYKPPVGIAGILLGLRFIIQDDSKISSMVALNRAEKDEGGRMRRRRRKGRSLDLDATDRVYDRYGGVFMVRGELLLKLLEEEYPLESSSSSSSSSSEVVGLLKLGLMLSCPPRGSREWVVERLVYPLSQVKSLLLDSQSRASLASPATAKKKGSDAFSSSTSKVLTGSALVIEIRTLDALLRILRDRLLVSSTRLKRFERKCSQRIFWYDRITAWRLMGRFVTQSSLSDDRLRLSLASANYKREIGRLGEVQKVLLKRPKDMERLLEDSTDMENDEGWETAAEEWTKAARGVICRSISATLPDTPAKHPSNETSSSSSSSADLISSWCSQSKDSSLSTWKFILSKVDSFATSRRRKSARYPFISDLRAIDYLGLPSSLLVLCACLALHDIVKPHWPHIIATTKWWFKALWGIIEFRFYIPFKVIILDLLNKRPRMLDPYALSNEEMSLDNMLKDLGLGDGTSSSRPAAVAAASRMYEQELKTGAIRGFFRGTMLRLLLVQVQQLKAGLLKAMDSIDDLVDSNRLNVQLLAGIPGLLIITYGTKLFFQSLFSLRTREFKPIRDVHDEMMEYLNDMESCLLLAEADDTQNNDDDVAVPKKNDLGEFILSAYSYLVLLDYTSPPFPSRACDSIHSSLQDLIMLCSTKGAGRRQIDLLALIKTKHTALLKSL